MILTRERRSGMCQDSRQATQLVGDPRTWRVRAGDWRILYEIHDDDIVVLILDVKQRSKAYGGH